MDPRLKAEEDREWVGLLAKLASLPGAAVSTALVPPLHKALSARRNVTVSA
ncbi:hypothetical protein HJB84_11410 [Rhizobium sp. NZLR1b]|uniref:hypothetical protein n=1 Tax=Rhizobium sp. NZLR1b TaxID=2731099 RepID=UPI001C82CAA3|nr:hypothetical protein [Rhizobium sp. NZLR1b]MBX5170463.1 hypothetical protein [Rhizobium sp. NZLR1b]